MISNLLKRFLKVAWFLPGFLLWASFPPMGEKTDIVFALAPLLWLSRRSDVRTSAWRWFQSGAFFWVATLSWMPAIIKNGGPWPLVVLGWLGLAAYCTAYFAAFGYLSAAYWTFARERSLAWQEEGRKGAYVFRLAGILLVEPVLWCGLELIRSRFLGGFAWNQLGVVPANGGFGAPAAWGGVYLLSAVVILINGTIAGIAERLWKPEASGFTSLKRLGTLETFLVFGLVWAIFQTSQTSHTSHTSQPFLKVALVQRNFPCVFKRQEESPRTVYEELLKNVSLLRPDVVVLAESAMCEFGPVDQQGAIRFAERISSQCGGAAVLAGGTRYEDDKTYNSAALYQPPQPPHTSQPSHTSHTSLNLSLYDKVHLVPFGEFIPGDKIFPVLQKLAPVGSCTPGELKLLPLSVQTNISVGVAICFEDTDSAQMRRLAAMGAKALFFITNDSWFSHSVEAEQHAWQATARAIETGLPVLRVGNSGVTGTISPEGKATWLLGTNGKPLVDRQGTMCDRVPVSADGEDRLPTFYVAFGDWPLGVAFLLLTVGMILVKYKAHYEKRRKLSM